MLDRLLEKDGAEAVAALCQDEGLSSAKVWCPPPSHCSRNSAMGLLISVYAGPGRYQQQPCMSVVLTFTLLPASVTPGGSRVLLQSLFKEAIERASAGEGSICGYQWYVYSCQAGYLLRRAAFLLENIGTDP